METTGHKDETFEAIFALLDQGAHQLERVAGFYGADGERYGILMEAGLRSIAMAKRLADDQERENES